MACAETFDDWTDKVMIAYQPATGNTFRETLDVDARRTVVANFMAEVLADEPPEHLRGDSWEHPLDRLQSPVDVRPANSPMPYDPIWWARQNELLAASPDWLVGRELEAHLRREWPQCPGQQPENRIGKLREQMALAKAPWPTAEQHEAERVFALLKSMLAELISEVIAAELPDALQYLLERREAIRAAA